VLLRIGGLKIREVFGGEQTAVEKVRIADAAAQDRFENIDNAHHFSPALTSLACFDSPADPFSLTRGEFLDLHHEASRGCIALRIRNADQNAAILKLQKFKGHRDRLGRFLRRYGGAMH